MYTELRIVFFLCNISFAVRYICKQHNVFMYKGESPTQHFIQIEILLLASLDEDQLVQRIQSDSDLHL